MSFRSKIEYKIPYIIKFLKLQIYVGICVPLTIFELYKIFCKPGHETSIRIWICVLLLVEFAGYYMDVVQFGFHFIYMNFFINIKQRYYLTIMNKFIAMKSYFYYKNIDF